MKNFPTILFLILIFCLSEKLFSQSPNITEYGIFDNVKDNFGNSYKLADLSFNATSGGGGAPASPPPTVSCQAGYFTLFYASGSYLAGSTSAQSVVCEVFSNVSSFISSNIPLGSINIYCEDTPILSTYFGQAVSYYVFPTLPNNNYQGLIYSQVQKALLTGVNPYSTIPTSVFFNSNQFYYGALRINPTPPGGTWNLNMATQNIASTEYDLYSVVLHEVTHLLGINSLIGPTGNSTISDNYYGKFDQYLFDSGGSPLIAPSMTSCPNGTMSFVASTLAISPTNCTSTITNITNCTAAVQYSTANAHLKIYTPDCYEPSSSLSHFEDMCSTPSFTPTGPVSCTPTPSSPGFNDMYFVMTNSGSVGPCYVKRYWKQEEKCVLCDIGYSVNTAYISNAVVYNSSTIYYYNTTCPSSVQVIGRDDGLANSAYTYTTVTGTFTTPLSQISLNDTYTSTLQVSCLEVIYSGATATAGVTNLTVTAGTGSGLVILKYYPTDGNGHFGNATYIYVYFIPSGCNPSTACNMVGNPGFEVNQSTNAVNCGSFGNSSPITVSCWEACNSNQLPFLFGTSCSSSSSQNLVLGVNTLNSTPPVSAINFTPNANNYCVSTRFSQTYGQSLAVKNILSTPLVTTGTYQVSFWAINHSSGPSNLQMNPNNSPIVISVASFPTFASGSFTNYPTGLSILTEFTLNAGTTWTQLISTFVYTPSVQGGALFIGINSIDTPTTTGYYELFLDEVSLVSAPGPSLNFTTPTICGATGLTDLMQYASINTGTFSGFGVTLSGSQYNFNSPPSLGAGNYFITYSYTNGGCNGVLYDQISLPLVTTCCTDTSIPEYTGSSVTGTGNLFSGPLRIVNDFTIQPGADLLMTWEMIFSSNVQITVSNNAALYIQNAHLYSCGNDMWKGIVVQDGGMVSSVGSIQGDNLIEDAITAIDISNHTTSTLSVILATDNTIFNKNHVDININNYQRTSGSSPFLINSCVFTCRNLPFASIDWPQTGTVSSSTSYSADLRYATTATTGLVSPYLGQSNFNITNLKNPYANERSRAAIVLTNVGVTSGTVFSNIEIGKGSSSGDAGLFNLFDAHSYFIKAYNSNVIAKNNVFQNTQQYIGQVGQISIPQGGNAIDHQNQIMNSVLSVSASSQALGNRFWNCHIGINTINMLRFYMQNAIVRSTQVNTQSGYQQGRTGLRLVTNRFQYYIRDNEFTNVLYPVSIPIGADVYTTITTGTQIGIYADRIILLNNTFSSGTFTVNTIKTAINITCPNQFPFTVANDYNVSPYTKAIAIQGNTLNAVERGVYINGISGYQTTVESNSISLRTDANNNVQNGVELVNCMSAGNVGGLQTVSENSVTGSTSLTSQSAYYMSGNTGSYSPFISCNDANSAGQGFVFSGLNTPTTGINGTQWYGNSMTNLTRGMVLTNTAIIGAQGNSLIGCGNMWVGSIWSSIILNTFTQNSDAGLSPLYCAPQSSLNPPNNNGIPNSDSYAGIGKTPIVVSGGGNFSCSDPSAMTSTFQSNYDDMSDEVKAIAELNLYRFLKYNDDVKGSNTELNIWYTNLSGSNVELLTDIEQNLYLGDYSTALITLGGITSSNAIETNYIQFYTLYANYLHNKANDDLFSGSDSLSLITLAVLCPEENGNCIYQARALYEYIYRLTRYYSGCGDETEARVVPNTGLKNQFSQVAVDFKIFPNPNSGSFTIFANDYNKEGSIDVYDCTGQLKLKKQVKFYDSKVEIQLELPAGLYNIVLTNNNGVQNSQKMVISK